jgi:hypothetical protein
MNKQVFWAKPKFYMLLLTIQLLSWGALAQTTNTFYQYPGTKKMAALLDKIA